MRISDWSSDVCSSDLRLRGLVEAVVLDGAAHLGLDLGELADDPAVHPLAVAGRIEAGLVAAFVHLAEARGVPDLGAEVAIALDAALGELDVAALRGQRREGEAHRVGAELVDEVERVQDVRSEEHTSELQSLMRI